VSPVPQSPPVPLRVLVKGSSLVNQISWMGGPRTDFTFPRALEEQLLADGRPCEVRTVTAMAELTSPILKTWQQESLGYSPDVIVLLYGYVETIHLFLPRWLERHANSWRARPRRPGSLYRKVILRPTWKLLVRLQTQLDKVVPTVRRGRPRKVAADLEKYVSQVQQVASPLVLLVELLPPGQRFRTWFPGMTARIGIMNEAIAAAVARIDLPNVRYFRISPLVDEHYDGDIEVATPDGSHYSPTLHRHIGRALAAEIEDWADTQPHLAHE
jgi:hypothetical protein